MISALRRNLIQRRSWVASQPAQQFSIFWDIVLGKTAESQRPVNAVAQGRKVPRHRYGLSWNDPFSWMEEMAPDFWQHVKSESAATQKLMSSQWGTELQDVHEELLNISKAAQEASFASRPPNERIGQYEYYTVTSDKQRTPHYMRRHVESGKEESVLDLNALVDEIEGPFLVEEITVSPSQNLCAFTLSTDESLPTTIVRDVQTGHELDALHGTKAILWQNDDSHILYTTCSSEPRPDKVFRHIIGQDQSLDRVLIQERRKDQYLSLNKTKDDRFVVISSNSKTASEIFLMDAADPEGKLFLVQKGQQGLEYYVEHHDGSLLILTNVNGAMNNCLMTAPVKSPSKRYWNCFVPERRGVAIEDLLKFKEHAVLFERYRSRPGLSIVPLPGETQISGQSSEQAEAVHRRKLVMEALLDEVPVPRHCPQGMKSFCVRADSHITQLTPGANMTHDTSQFVCHASSPIQPDRTVIIDLQPDLGLIELPIRTDGALSVLEATGDNANDLFRRTLQDFHCRLESVMSKDGEEVPLTIVSRRCPSDEASADLPAVESQPCLMKIYGAYGMCLPTDFCPLHLALLSRGWNLAFAHVRGGGEQGRRWHHKGRRRGKLKALEDGHACVDYLLSHGLATSGSIALGTSSAGGILASQLLLQRPHDFGAAAFRMPFTDLLTTMTDPTHPLTEHEWGEWGDPNEAGDLELLRELCPYQSVSKLPNGTNFPPTLLVVGASDERVPPWMTVKWAAALRSHLGEKCPVHIKLVPGGHFLTDDEVLQVEAWEMCWLQQFVLNGQISQGTNSQ